jgi:hypothetical protein
MKEINKLKAQIKALNIKLNTGQTKNRYALENKIKALKSQYQILLDNYNWEAFLSN